MFFKLYRIGFYLIGFSVGLMFLTFILDKKKTEFNYSPSARVKSNLLKKKVRISSKLLIENQILTDSLIENKSRPKVNVFKFKINIFKKSFF